MNTIQKEELVVSVVGSSMMYEVKRIIMGFDYRKKCDVDKGRQLAVTAAQLLLKKINENEKIRQYLIKHPFTEDDVSISIYCFWEGKIPPLSSLSVVACRNGKIMYMVGAENDVIFEETYQEALRIVREQEKRAI